MADYISREALRKAMYHEAFETDSDMQKWDSGCWIRYKMFENVIEGIPAADVVEVVRCGDCKHFDPFREKDGFCRIDGMLWQITHYCACGKRKEQNDETVSL